MSRRSLRHSSRTPANSSTRPMRRSVCSTLRARPSSGLRVGGMDAATAGADRTGPDRARTARARCCRIRVRSGLRGSPTMRVHVGFRRTIRRWSQFLGVPILLGGVVFGNLYMTEKRSGAFTAEDEVSAQVFAAQAAVAIDNALRFARERGADRDPRRAAGDDPRGPGRARRRGADQPAPRDDPGGGGRAGRCPRPARTARASPSLRTTTS